jgi:predicted metal-dependent hydrolase
MSKVLSTQLSGDSTIPVRKMSFDFSNVPKDYMNGSLAKSHLFDGLNLLFPEGERFSMAKQMLYQSSKSPTTLVLAIRRFFSELLKNGLE